MLSGVKYANMEGFAEPVTCFRGFSVKLQGCYIDAVHAHKNIETVKSTLTKLEVDIENFHRKAYGEALLGCQNVGIEAATSQVISTQRHCQNISADYSSDCYKCTQQSQSSH